MDEKNLSDTDILTKFPLVLQERCMMKRRRRNQPLATYSFFLVGLYSQLNNSEYLRELASEKINYILEDCEVFHDMNTIKAMDAMRELSNWAAMFVGDERYSHIYTRICELIRLIRLAYPLRVN